MHSGAVQIIPGLRHEGRMQAVPSGYGLYRKLKGLYVVRRLNSLVKHEIYLMLGRRFLMLRGNDIKTHVLKHQYYVTSGILSRIQGCQVKVPRLFRGLRGRIAVFVRIKQEKFALWLLQRFLLYLLKHISGIPLETLSVRPVYVADKPCDLPRLRPPGECHKGGKIRMQVHIRFLYPCKALDKRAVKKTLVIHGLLQLIPGHGHILHGAEHVRKLEPYELYVLFFHISDYLVLCADAHTSLLIIPLHLPQLYGL